LKTDAVNTENGEFQLIQALKLSRTKRAERNEIFIEGIQAVKMAVKAGLEITRIIFAASGAPELSPWGRDLIRGNPGARVLAAAAPLYRKLCGRMEPLELLVTARKKAPVLGRLNLPRDPFLLLFDRPSDAGNLGSTVRSLNAFGGDALLILGHGVDPWDPKVIRSSLGSVFFTPVVSLGSNRELEDFIAEQRGLNGLRVWGTDSAGAVPLSAAGLRRPLLLAVGNEAKGISAALKQLCDGIAGIPLLGEVDSLNAACAASICMWELQRGAGAAGMPAANGFLSAQGIAAEIPQ
jgi:TrmH family RNA methyltransferase